MSAASLPKELDRARRISRYTSLRHRELSDLRIKLSNQLTKLGYRARREKGRAEAALDCHRSLIRSSGSVSETKLFSELHSRQAKRSSLSLKQLEHQAADLLQKQLLVANVFAASRKRCQHAEQLNLAANRQAAGALETLINS